MTDALNNMVQLGYFNGDLVTATDPLGNVSQQFADGAGRVFSATGAQGNTAKSQYNNLNLLTQVTDAQGHNTAFAYDANGNLLSLTDPLNHATSYTYDSMNRTLTRTDPLNRQESFSYDLNGNLVSSTDRGGQVTSIIYDPLNRVKLVGYNMLVNGGNTTYESTISYIYDAGSRLTQVVDSAGGTITRAYDDLDRLTSETTSQGSISYSYDAAGRRTSMQVAGQPVVSYSYDNASRLTQITQGSARTSFGYDNADRRTSLTLPNGVAASYGYDNGSRLTGITYQLGPNTLGSLTYTYDQLGRRTQVGGNFARTGLPGAMTSATYDAANELTNWNGTSISYDLNGNMLADGTHTFTWNSRNQVASLNNVSLQYDAVGRRIRNLAGTSFLYSGANPAQELSGSTVTANLVSGGLDEFFTRTDSSGSFTPLSDALGSTIALVNSGGNVQTSYTYDPFGNTTISGLASANPSQYTSRENEGNGLYYLRARYYSPALHRFISQDPLGFAGSGVNFYSYVFDDPINLKDPSGLDGGNPPLPPGMTAVDIPLAGRKDSPDDCNGRIGCRYAKFHIKWDRFWTKFWCHISCPLEGAETAVAADPFVNPSGQPPLIWLHSKNTIMKDNPDGYNYWNGKSTEDIIDSLGGGSAEPFLVKRDGTIMNGNTRALILQQRGVDVERLPRVIYEPPEIFPELKIPKIP
jgi:RHS repeat-associated protein